MKAEGRRLILVHLLLLVLLYEIMFVPNQRTTGRSSQPVARAARIWMA